MDRHAVAAELEPMLIELTDLAQDLLIAVADGLEKHRWMFSAQAT